MEIKRFFECSLPVNACNLKCPYCYVIQEERRKNQIPPIEYSPEHIAKALRRERVGGICYISICGFGETLLQPECVDIVQQLLQEGHFVNITTNGTLTPKFKELIEKSGENISHLHISFSLHYTELKRLNLLNTYFDNVNRMRSAGASVLVQFNLCDEYLPYLEEIKKLCVENVGAMPQVALTRDESVRPMRIWSSLSTEEYYERGTQFDSGLFAFTNQNFNVQRTEFCYAGAWSGVLNMQTGELDKCYCNRDRTQNIFKNIEEPILFEAVGRDCHNSYCVNSSHFMSLGVIPSLKTPTYGQLRNRPEAGWYSNVMENFLNGKLYDANRQYTVCEKMKLGWKLGNGKREKLKKAIKFAMPQGMLECIHHIRYGR